MKTDTCVLPARMARCLIAFMREGLRPLGFALAAFLPFFLSSAPAFTQSGQDAWVIRLEGPIGPATADFAVRGLASAQESRSRLVILRIDTPGGLDSSMRLIVKEILASRIPVVGYVAPSGARAASAGTYILLATHVAAMSPGTNIGAATPVSIGGGPPGTPSGDKGTEDKEASKGETDPPTTADKAVSDARAYIRSLAQLRGRNVEWAEKTVSEASSLSATEALADNVVDIIATGLPDLLNQLNGWKVDLPDGERSLATRGLTITHLEPDWRTKTLAIITNPNIAYILLLIGIYGLVLEFYNPGVLVAGITGTISLLLALYAFQLVPVNVAGLALLAIGLGLMIAEATVPSFGILGIGGTAAFVLGSIFLFDSDIPGFEVSPILIGSIAAVSSGLFMFIVIMLMRARKRSVVTGQEEMLNSQALVLDWAGMQGHVRVHGEVWQAEGPEPVSEGSKVRVTAIDGLTLKVQPIESEGSQ